jgi:membrane-associated protease RseP (regulator of RpoE activity)
MLTALLVFVLNVLVNGAAFIGFRYAAARFARVRGVGAVLGINHRPWREVPLGRRVLFAVAGPLGCYLCAASFVAIALLVSGRAVVDEASMRVRVMPFSPAAEAGFVDGDMLVSVNEVAVPDWGILRERVASHARESIRVRVLREGEDLILSPTVGHTGKIGVAPLTVHEDVGVGSAVVAGLSEPPKVWASVYRALVTDPVPQPSLEVAGPVRIAKGMSEASPSIGALIRGVGAWNASWFWIPSLLGFLLFPRTGRRRATS